VAVSIPSSILIYLNRGTVGLKSSPICFFGFLVIGWPPMVVIILKFFGISLSEFNFVAIRFMPALIFGLLSIRLDSIKTIRQEAIFFLIPPLIALVYGVFDQQTYLYPIAWTLLALPYLFVTQTEINRFAINSIYKLCIRGILIVAVGIAFIQPEKAFTTCRADKCNTLGFVFAPEETQSNVMSLTLGLLVALIDSRKRYVWIVANAFCLIFLAEFAGGRSGTAAGVGCFLSLLILKIGSEKISFTYKIYVSSLFFFSLIPVFFTFNPGQFTGRASLWISAREFIRESPLFGHGASFWIRLPATNELQANYSPHNIWLEILLATGLMGTVSLCVAVIVSLAKCDSGIRPVALSILSGLFVAGFSEAIVIPYRLIIAPGFFLVFIGITSSRKSRDEMRA